MSDVTDLKLFFCFCQRSVKESEDVLQAPVDDEGTVKDFCGQTCMSSFNYKKSVTIGIPMVPVKSHSQCCMCNRYCIVRDRKLMKSKKNISDSRRSPAAPVSLSSRRADMRSHTRSVCRNCAATAVSCASVTSTT